MIGLGAAVSAPNALPPPAIVTPPGNLALQGGMDTVNYPTGIYNIPANAPMWSDGPFRIATAGSGIVVYGDQFTPDTVFLVHDGQPGAVGTCAILGVVDVFNNVATMILPTTLQANGMYLVWPQNSIGTGEPFVIGRPEARWLCCDSTGWGSGPVGDICYVQGINLSSQAFTPRCWIALAPAAGGNAVYVDATGANVSVGPYSVQFTIPSLPAGNYRVFLHNGHGGELGWCECFQQLTIAAALAFTSTAHPTPIDAGAPSGSDDLPHLQSLVNSINSPAVGAATISLRTGHYKLSGPLTMGGAFPISFTGQGAGITFIEPM